MDALKIAGMTPQEWAADALTVILLSENPRAVLTALVELIHIESVHQTAVAWMKFEAQAKLKAQVEEERNRRNAERRERKVN